MIVVSRYRLERNRKEDFFWLLYFPKVVNYSLACELFLKALNITEEEFVSYLLALSEEKEVDEKMSLVEDYEYDFLAEILGFDAEEAAFSQDGIDFLESSYGCETKELMEQLGFELHENIDYGPHGHGTTGVVYCDRVGDIAKQ